MQLTVRKSNGEVKTLDWHWLQPEQIDEMMALEDRVVESAQDPSLYRRESADTILASMKDGAGCIGGFVDGQLIGVRYVSYPSDYDLSEGIIEKENSRQVLHMETMIVDPDFRGNALQVKSFYYLLAHLPREVEFLFSTVSPFNLPSLKSVFKYGSRMVDLRLMYPTDEEPEGVLRYIGARGLVLDLAEERTEAALDDIETQQALFRDGQVATGLKDDETVVFQKVIRSAVPLNKKK